MNSANRLHLDRQTPLNRTHDTNQGSAAPAVTKAKVLISSLYKGLQKGRANILLCKKRQKEPLPTKNHALSASQNIILRSLPGHKGEQCTLTSPNLNKMSVGPTTASPPSLTSIREFAAGTRIEQEFKRIIKSKSSVIIGEPELLAQTHLPMVLSHGPIADRSEAALAESRPGDKPYDSPAPRLKMDMILGCLKKNTPLPKKHRFYVSAVEISPSSSSKLIIRQSFVQTSSKPRTERLKLSHFQPSETLYSPKEKPDFSLTRPQAGTKVPSVRVGKTFKTVKNLSGSDSTHTEKTLLSRPIFSEKPHPKLEPGVSNFSRRMDRFWRSPNLKAAMLRRAEVASKAAEYYTRDLEDAFSGRLTGYFAGVFATHLRKSVLTLETMRDMGHSRSRARMLPVCLDTHGSGRPAFPENINIYLNYQMSNRASAAEPNFYKQSYETMLARRKEGESAADTRVSSESKTNKRMSLRGGNWRTPRAEYKQSFSTEPEAEVERPKKTIIFDLDETLIHSCKKPSETFDRSVKARTPSRAEKVIGFNVRPHLEELLEALKNDFELVIFTASQYCYANPILDDIDPCRYFKTRLFREHCDQVGGSVFIKDLAILKDRDLKNVVLVDNSVSSFASQVSNGIPIIPFIDNKADDQLVKLKWFLLRLKDCDDVRPLIAAHFDWDGWKRRFVVQEGGAGGVAAEGI